MVGSSARESRVAVFVVERERERKGERGGRERERESSRSGSGLVGSSARLSLQQMFFQRTFERVAVPFCPDLFRDRVPDCPVSRCILAFLVFRLLDLGVSVGVGVWDVLVALEGVAGGVVVEFCCP